VRDRDGNPADGPHVGRDVLAGFAVAARAREHELPTVVDDLDTGSVELRLHAEYGRGPGRQPVVHTAHELLQLLFAVGVVEREHPHGMPDFGSSRAWLAGDTLGGRLRGHELRVSGLERAQLAQQRVELGVGDARIVEHVVPVVVGLDLTDECGVLLGRGGGHREPARA